ncbi:MAG: hypothetical protein A2Y97_03240 [Nitrospirae bacterium RBG_13_39_12]|nr:MAG: hypothetical protein A2Y97_03240 [Nitrospirae bacterium RBG_13_39_12]
MNNLSNIDKKIKELNRKRASTDDLNALGDLYLRKGDKKLAIEQFYKAAKEISYTQKNKAVAIYKKILSISPNETNALEEIINVFSKSRLVGEQIKYLLLLSKLYQNKGDLKKANSIFRKIQELDPKNNDAEVFFSRGKLNVSRRNTQSRD